MIDFFNLDPRTTRFTIAYRLWTWFLKPRKTIVLWFWFHHLQSTTRSTSWESVLISINKVEMA